MELLSGYINVQEAMLSAYGISPMIVNLYVRRRLLTILFCLTAARAACIINWTTPLTFFHQSCVHAYIALRTILPSPFGPTQCPNCDHSVLPRWQQERHAHVALPADAEEVVQVRA